MNELDTSSRFSPAVERRLPDDQPAESTADALFARLSAEPWRFDVFQAVRRLDCVAAAGRPPVGTSGWPSDDPVRFAQAPSLAFAPSAVSAFDLPTPHGGPPRMWVDFFGMWGPNGPLPLHLTEYARDRERHERDPTLARFMDVFHHRMLSLFYRAWAVNQQAVAADRPGDGRFAAYVGSLTGRGTASLQGRDTVPDDAKRYWAGHLAGGTAHAEGLESILSGHFGVPCRVLPFAGEWIDLPPESRCRLGRSPEAGLLGQTTVLGTKVWDCQGRFRLRLGPMPMDKFARLLPGRPDNRQLRDWIRNYVGDELAWEVRVILKSESVPNIRLGDGSEQVAGSERLGWSTWLSTAAGRRRADTDDLVLRSTDAESGN